MFKRLAWGHRKMPPPVRALDLPPRFRPVALRELHDSFNYTTAHAATLGVGTLVFVGRFDVAEFAVVLEPEEPLAVARRAFYAGMLALADTLAGLAPPETSIAIAWPDAVHVGGKLVGGGRLAWPRGAEEDVTPDWLVFGAIVRLTSTKGERSGSHSMLTTLQHEGFGEIGAERFIEGFARRLMAAFDHWRDGDFAALGRNYLVRSTRAPGARLAIESDGDLRSALKSPSWLGTVTGVPRQ
jgi:biotin-(acetyl-CoA carboxylase) ligase